MDNFERAERERQEEAARSSFGFISLDILSGDGQTCTQCQTPLLFKPFVEKTKVDVQLQSYPLFEGLQHRSTPDDDDLRRRRLQQHRTHLLLLTHATKNQSPLPPPNRPHNPRHPPRRLRPIHILLHTPPRTSSSWTMCEEGFIALSYVQEFVWDEGGGSRWKWRR
jgi:hypothetical protein